ncbi:homeobox protein prospero-like [Ornithodoros turicata]
MSSEEDSAEGPDRTFLRAKAKRARQRVDAGEPRSGNNSLVASPFLRSPPALRNGFMSSPKGLDDLLEAAAAEEAEVRPANGDATPHLLRDILQSRREDDEEEDEEEEDVEDEAPSADAASSMDCVTARASDDEDETGNSVRTSGGSSTGAVDAKKARVENIVSNMLLGPPRPGPNGNGGSDALSTPVNGCKKRKLYQPQQANRAASGDEEEDGLDDSFDEEPNAKQRRLDREAFRRDLLRLQTQVATMQRRYDEMRSDEEDLVSEDSAADDVSADAPRSSPLRDVKPPTRDVTPPPILSDTRDDRDVKRPHPEARQTCIVRPQPAMDVDRLVSALKNEMTQILPRVIDGIVSRFTDRRSEARSPATTTKDQSLLTQMLDSKSPRSMNAAKVIDRGRLNGHVQPPQPPLNAASLRSSPCEASRTLFPGGSPYKAASFGNGDLPEQTEAMSLVVPAKKKRHKVTDTRLTPRDSPKCGETPGFPPPPLVPVSLPTTVAIPNPSLHHHADVFSFHVDHPRLYDEDGHPGAHHPGGHHPPPLPLMLTHSPDSLHYPALHPPPPPPPPPPSARHQQENDSDNGDSQGYDSGMAMISFLKYINGGGAGGGGSARGTPPGPLARDSSSQSTGSDSPGGGYKGSSMSGSLGPGGYTSTLTPMHLRKAKLMFFYVRYPSSAILKMYFPDINFNKNNTAQLVKWFSNFREFYYIQMEKYARQSVSEGVKNVEDLKVSADSELLRVLNLHYNRNNHIEVPENFRYVVEQTLREFFRAIVAGKDQEQSWKKAIYKVIARLDDNVPEYFKSPNFLEQLE